MLFCSLLSKIVYIPVFVTFSCVLTAERATERVRGAYEDRREIDKEKREREREERERERERERDAC